MNKNLFTIAEDKGRELLREFLTKRNIKVSFTEDLYSSYDAETDKAIYEIKVRDCNSNTYKDYILEEHKVLEMLKLKEQNNKRIYYVNFFNDGKMILWDIERVCKLYNPTTKSCRRTTAVYGGYKEKKVYMIEPKNGVIFDLEK